LPATSCARTANERDPSGSPPVGCGLEQGIKGPPSIEQLKEATPEPPGSLPVKENVAEPEFEKAGGLAVIAVSGAVPSGVTEFDAADAGPVPTALVAVTVQVTGTPLVRLPTVMGEDGPVAVRAAQVAV
jgi:hypothetical protein